MASFTDGNDSYRLAEVSHEASKKERDFEFNKPYCMTFIFKKYENMLSKGNFKTYYSLDNFDPKPLNFCDKK
jgi:hypothetical protein